MKKYSKGATWRIWDLQIQTILDDRYISLESYYTTLKQDNPDKWNVFVEKIGGEENAILFDSKQYFGDNLVPKKERCVNYVRTTFAFLEVYKPDLGVVGLTDHNYYDDELIDAFYEYSASASCKVICGVEINVSGVHLLVYFSKPPYNKATFSAGIKTFLSKINVDEPKRSGTLTVCSKSCQIVIDEIKSSDGIYIFPHCNSSNGLFQERGRTDRTHLADVFNYSTIIILQANSKDSVAKTAAYVRSNTALKSIPVYTTASDARCLNEFGNPDSEGYYTWIKADPTFDGLKQILFEPTSRVRLEKNLPEVKNDYLVIDKVRFIGSDSVDLFSSDYIDINDKLNGIIGGKSSGKSILLYYIAKAIDKEQVRRKIEDSGLDLTYDFDNHPNFDFEVVWQDGVSYRLSDISQAKPRQITYVPQMFINYLAEKGGQKELRKLIQEILEQIPEFKLLYDLHIDVVKANKIVLAAAIEKFYQANDDLARNSDTLKSKGDKKARQQNLQQKIEAIDNLRLTAGFSEQDESIFQELRSTQKIYTTRFTNLTGLKNLFESDYLNHLMWLKANIAPSLNNINLNSIGKFLRIPMIAGFLDKYIQKDNDDINTVFDKLIEKVNETILRLSGLLQKNEISLKKYRQQLEPYLAKIKDQEKLDDLNKDIATEQGVLLEIDDLESTRLALQKTKEHAKNEFLSAYEHIYRSYRTIVDKVNSTAQFSQISEDRGIYLSAGIGFDVERFHPSTLGFINSQGYLSSKLGTYINSENSFVFDEQNHLMNIEDFFNKIQYPTKYNLRFNQGGDSQNISKQLLNDYFYITYEISQNAESILRMSPGKKGMILLFLILHLSSAEYPILIDQPEDNLDNRTVYKELKEFIKEKKILRQIIIVTHNANLIVPTDAENVIVANQKGQDSNKDNRKFRFEYTTGSLENTFIDISADGILNQMGIKEHVCDILEGGAQAFLEREQKYDLKVVFN